MIVVTGSRTWSLQEPVRTVLGKASVRGETDLFHGGARGLDQMAGHWAARNGLDVRVFPADWDRLGRAAGFQRNEEMLLAGMARATELAQPLVVLAFKQGFNHSLSRGGTEHMVKLALLNDVPVHLHDGRGWLKLSE